MSVFTKRTPIYTKSERKGVISAADSCYYLAKWERIPVIWKKVDRSRHYMRIVKGYGMQEDIYNGYVKNNRGWVVIEEKPSNTLMVAEMDVWESKGKTMEFRRDDGSQRFLSEKYMEKLASIDELENYLHNHLPKDKPKQQPLLRFK